MKLAGIILAGALGLGSLGIVGNSIDKENSQETERPKQENIYMCPMTEVDCMEGMRNRCTQYHRDREETDNQRHLMYRNCM